MSSLTPWDWLQNFSQLFAVCRARLAKKEVPLSEGLAGIATLLDQTQANAKRVYWVGNGGSSALCQHLSQDLINKLKIPSYTFSDAALITCMANDYGYENVYATPLQVLIQPNDLLIAISSSGRSENILRSVRLAQECGAHSIALSGFSDNNPLWAEPVAVGLYFPSTLYGQVEIGHEALLHSVIETLWLKTVKKLDSTKGH